MIQRNNRFRGDEAKCDWFCKHSVWISKRTLGRTPIPMPDCKQTKGERNNVRICTWHDDRRSYGSFCNVSFHSWKAGGRGTGAVPDETERDHRAWCVHLFCKQPGRGTVPSGRRGESCTECPKWRA